MTVPHDRLFWTVGNVADLLACAPGTVCRWVDDGKLPGTRLPGSNHRRIARADLDAFIREHYARTLDDLLEAAARIAGGPKTVG